MFKIVGTLPVKTRLPFAAWVLAGLVTLFSLATSLTQVSSPMVQAAKPATAHSTQFIRGTLGPELNGGPVLRGGPLRFPLNNHLVARQFLSA
jgi:hypothetical protein